MLRTGARPPQFPIINNICDVVPEAPNSFILVQLSFLYILELLRFEGHSANNNMNNRVFMAQPCALIVPRDFSTTVPNPHSDITFYNIFRKYMKINEHPQTSTTICNNLKKRKNM